MTSRVEILRVVNTRLVLAILLLVTLCMVAPADDTWVYAVQLHALVKASPPQISLFWRDDPYGVSGYTIYRKAKSDPSWAAPIATLPGTTTNFTDLAVSPGSAYEYQVVKTGALGYTGYGYIYTGIESSLVDDRGKLILVREVSATSGLDSELDTLRSDLVGDGWEVIDLPVRSDDSPENVRLAIQQIYFSDPDRVNTVFLLGHVPILHSGNIDWDTHGGRPMPADAYYGEMSDDWPTDPGNSPSYMPSDIELMVGRVDFFNMPGQGATPPWPSESELLRGYLHKNHKWRHQQLEVPRRALVGNLRGDEAGGAPAASVYRAFDAFVGPQNLFESNVSYDPPLSSRWISILGKQPYLWAYGCGGGTPNGCGGLGTNVVGGVPGYLYSQDVVAVDAKAVFVGMFGSWFGQWDLQDNLLRSFLATPTYGLAAFMSGRPHWFLHHMALGEPIGYSVRLSMNNRSLYRNQSNGFPAAVYIALMGDPTLRMEPLAPPASLDTTPGQGSVTLNWAPVSYPVRGYHVYRAADRFGPFRRLTDDLVSGTNFTDRAVAPGSYAYMVRAVALQVNPSGSYLNPSQGIFAEASVAEAAEQIHVNVSKADDSIILSWNSVAGAFYHVLALESGTPSAWRDISGPVPANSGITSWTDSDPSTDRARLYRIVRPVP